AGRRRGASARRRKARRRARSVRRSRRARRAVRERRGGRARSGHRGALSETPLLDQSAPTGPRETGLGGCAVFGQAGSSAGSLEPVPLRTAGLRAWRQPSIGLVTALGVTMTGAGCIGCAGAPCTSTTVAGADCTGG